MLKIPNRARSASPSPAAATLIDEDYYDDALISLVEDLENNEPIPHRSPYTPDRSAHGQNSHSISGILASRQAPVSYNYPNLENVTEEYDSDFDDFGIDDSIESLRIKAEKLRNLI
jgi:hypothetical protein